MSAKSSVMEGEMSDEAFTAAGALTSAFDYLRGIDIRGCFSYTQKFFGLTLAEWIELQQAAAKPELLSIAPAPAEEDENNHEYPGWTIQNQEPLKPKGLCGTGLCGHDNLDFDLNPHPNLTAARKEEERDEPKDKP